jgi:glycine/D-amino acid oxidase-like deaminating enzyme
MILATADVTILGAGVFGLSIAFCAAQRGRGCG